MNTSRIFSSASRSSLAALLVASLAPLGCVAATDESVDDTGVEGDALTSGALYTIKGVQSGKCVGVAGASTADGANVEQSTCTTSTSQQWRLHSLADGGFQITSQHSGKCLDVAYYSTKDGANVQQWHCTGSANESWKAKWMATGEYELSPQHSGKCLDVAEHSLANGGNLQQWACGGGENQRFRLTAVGSAPPPPPPASGSPLAGSTFFVNTENAAVAEEAKTRKAGHIADADLLKKISTHAQGVWFADWSGDPKTAVSDTINRAGNTVPILVAYNIPGRDCSDYSKGGAANAAAYATWIDGFAAGIGDAKVAVILEPDSLWMTALHRCPQIANNLASLDYAVKSLKKHPNAHVYIDAGTNGTAGVSVIAAALKTAGIYEADGFALNTSESFDSASTESRGHQISDALGGKVHFVIDTSRNGRGQGDQSISQPWCNPEGLGLGKISTGNTGVDRVDAFLWIKQPGQSDGECNRNNPAAGQWFQERALEMAKNAVF